MSNSLEKRLSAYQTKDSAPRFVLSGTLNRVVGLTLEAIGFKAAIGSRCLVEAKNGSILAEVVGFAPGKVFLMPIEDMHGVMPGAFVTPLQQKQEIPVGFELLGRVVDSFGEPIDGKGKMITEDILSVDSVRLNPMTRRLVEQPLDVGVRSINALFTVGLGQRMGIFAGSGVGKSVLLGMMTKGTTADIVVVGLVGERGREVREFIEHILGEEGLSRAIVVASPADSSPLRRLKGCETAVAYAEYFRDQGLNVLLLVDSLTRYAQAQREIALAIGEPPATKGYPPSVFAKIPRLVERAGNGSESQGSITAFFTILTEGEQEQFDPVADAARAILDGHLFLSRELANSGIYPAVDVEHSISRVMPMIVSEQHNLCMQLFRHYYSAYERQKELIEIGAYQSGVDPQLDMAIRHHPRMNQFLMQNMNQLVDMESSCAQLFALAQSMDGSISNEQAST